MRSTAKQAFLRDHPICCFCGGSAIATTVDHQPAESLYPEGSRPKGFWFPACESCNAYSHKAESKLPLILSADASTEKDHQRFVGRVDAFMRHRPNIVPGMMMTNREKRNVLRDRGLKLADGVFLDDLPLMWLPGSDWEDAFDHLAHKLMLALHYRYSGSPLPSDGRIWFWVHSNVNFASGDVPAKLLQMRASMPVDPESVEATGGDLVIARQCDDDGGAYALNLRQRLFITGISTLDPSWITSPDKIDLRGPLTPNRPDA